MNSQLFACKHDGADPERATLPFVLANVAVASGVEATVVCTLDGVFLGRKGAVEGIAAPELAPLAELFAAFLAAGGRVWLCSACTKPRGVTEDQLAEGVVIVGAATIVEAVGQGGAFVSVT